MRYPTTDSSPGFLGLTRRAAPMPVAIPVKMFVVGVIDSGIWPEHPCLQTMDPIPHAAWMIRSGQPVNSAILLTTRTILLYLQ